MNVDEEVNPFPVLSCEERIRYIEKQRIAIRSLIVEFGLEREVHYTIYNRPFGFVYEGALKDLLVLDLVIYKIIYERERRELYLFYTRVRETGTMIDTDIDLEKSSLSLTCSTRPWQLYPSDSRWEPDRW